MTTNTLMTADDLRRAVVRIAHEIVEQTRGPERLVLAGIHTRGAVLARRLGDLIAEFEHVQVPVGSLDISLYRDDLERRGVRPTLHRTDLPVDISDQRVVLVDDVLFTGRTVRAALDALIAFGRPERILLAVLVDRGHRELPIRADFVGKNVPTSRAEEVQVLLNETDGREAVLLYQRDGGSAGDRQERGRR
ncbi:MAG: bifunctional pyr operon transcriptional regulator/uracil phosphoribosyltransferase PyrR [Dehalococcoidia bacterium]